MDQIIKKLTTVRSSMRAMTLLCAGALAAAAVIALGAVYVSSREGVSKMSNIYVLDKGEVSTATSAPEGSQRRLEAQDHVARVHEYLLNLPPSSEAIKSNVDKALAMSDRSVYNYYQDLSEQGFYQRLVSANISQQFTIDSVKVDMQSYPYAARVWGKLYLMRESNITQYDMSTSCRLVDVERSKENPHGMILEQFRVESNEKVATRRRM